MDSDGSKNMLRRSKLRNSVNTVARVTEMIATCRFVRARGSAILPVVSIPCDSNVSTKLTLRGLTLINGRNRWFDLLPTYATSTTVFLIGANCTVKFQFCEYGIFPLADVGVTAKPGMPRLLRKTKPLESVPKIE